MKLGLAALYFVLLCMTEGAEGGGIHEALLLTIAKFRSTLPEYCIRTEGLWASQRRDVLLIALNSQRSDRMTKMTAVIHPLRCKGANYTHGPLNCNQSINVIVSWVAAEMYAFSSVNHLLCVFHHIDQCSAMRSGRLRRSRRCLNIVFIDLVTGIVFFVIKLLDMCISRKERASTLGLKCWMRPQKAVLRRVVREGSAKRPRGVFLGTRPRADPPEWPY